MPPDSGLAFVVVQHLERHHPSVLAELLGKHTRMSVEQAEDGVRPKADHVYIIPPNAVLTLEKGLLRVARATEPGVRAPIDLFFRSLAQEKSESAIGIILSGAGSDGTIGLRAIKESGGLTVAQAPETAQYDSMPQSVISAGLVDFTLSVEEMPARLQAYAKRLAEIKRIGDEHLDAEVTANLGTICELLHRQTGHDFSRYKQGTLLRRIRRRLPLLQIASVTDYVRLLEKDLGEAQSLLRDLLIGVTQFFRDPEVFEALAEQAIPAIFKHGDPGAPVRIWVPGCASGEEAYSIAMLAYEHLARTEATSRVQIFGTDIDAEMLSTARRGRYPEDIRESVSPERLARFFTREGASYQVVNELRELCTFSEHSLIKDPPFSSLDLISCRNVLIYFGADLQKKLVPLFHYALRPGGFLLLGPSESLAAHADLFVTVDKKVRLFRRNEAVVRPAVEIPLFGRVETRAARPTPHQVLAPASRPQLFSHSFERMVLEEYAPPCAVINERGDILYTAGRTGRYLQAPAGAATNNILDLAQGRLRLEVRTALAKAVKSHSKAIREDVPVEVDGGVHRLRLTIRPLPGAGLESGLYAVVLQQVGIGEELEPGAEVASTDLPIVEQLENELRTTRADLQSAMEELESSNEELKSTNEELTSTNEELQSANEELQTSKEELQSSNDELHAKLQELDSTNADLQYHYADTQIATVFLDRDLRITKFTPAATQLLHLIEGDVGRSIRDLAPRFVEEDLLPDIQTVLRTEAPVERNVHRAEGPTWFLVRIQPHRSKDKGVKGVGVTLVDITKSERAEETVRRYGRLLQLSPDAIFVWLLDGGTETWNRGAEELYGFAEGEARGRAPRELLQTVFPFPWAKVAEELRAHGRWEGELRQKAKDGRELAVLAKLLLTRDEDGVERVLESDRDITELKRTEEALRAAVRALSEVDHNKNQFLAMLSHELRNPLAPIRNSLYLLDRAPPGGEQAKRAQAVIDRQVGHMTRLIDDLLDVARIARGKIQLHREFVDLRDVVARTIEDHRQLFVANGVELQIALGDATAQVHGDQTRLVQAIGNLLSNSAKFTPRGGWTRVELERDATHAVIRVRDSGAGIAKDMLPRLFEPFVQADGTLDRSPGGLGLGLAMVKGLVELHGGTVTARSDGPGTGAELTVRLPLANPVSTEVPKVGTAPCRAPRRILIIEDNVDAAESLREVLELDEHQVEVAHDGPRGLAKAREFQPEVVLCDIGLPGMDGYTVARVLRGDDKLRAAYLVALTGYALPEDLAKAREAGFDRHLAKPPTVEKLEEILSSAPMTPQRPESQGPTG